MKKKLVSAMILALLLSVMFVGTAFAHPDGAEDAFTANELDNSAPVGSGPANPNTDGLTKGNGKALDAIANNPLCPAHHPQG